MKSDLKELLSLLNSDEFKEKEKDIIGIFENISRMVSFRCGKFDFIFTLVDSFDEDDDYRSIRCIVCKDDESIIKIENEIDEIPAVNNIEYFIRYLKNFIKQRLISMER